MFSNKHYFKNQIFSLENHPYDPIQANHPERRKDQWFAWGQTGNWGVIAIERKGSFWGGDDNTVKLDCGDGSATLNLLPNLQNPAACSTPGQSVLCKLHLCKAVAETGNTTGAEPEASRGRLCTLLPSRALGKTMWSQQRKLVTSQESLDKPPAHRSSSDKVRERAWGARGQFHWTQDTAKSRP